MLSTPDQRLASERFHSYMRGWEHGAVRRSMDKAFTEHATRPDLTAEYKRGYTSGTTARRAASSRTAARTDYRPNILRARRAKGDGVK